MLYSVNKRNMEGEREREKTEIKLILRKCVKQGVCKL